MMGAKRARLSAIALGVALGVLYAAWMLTVGILASRGTFGMDLVTHWATFYPGVAATMTGAFVAGAWGFLKGFLIGLVLGWIYNLCLCCCTRCCPCCRCSCNSCGVAGHDEKKENP